MSDRRGKLLLAGILFVLLLVLPLFGLPYNSLDWTAYSQPYEDTPTPTSTSTVILTPTSTLTPTATATSTTTPTATVTLTPTTPPDEMDHFIYLPLVRRSATVSGSVLIEDGRCCAGGTAGDTVDIDVAYQASSPFGAVTEMRASSQYGGHCLSPQEMSQVAWETFVPSKTFPVSVVINWVGFYASAQYRDAMGHVSSVYCDDVSVEGMPAP